MEQRLVDSQSAFPFTKSQLSELIQKEMADGNWMAKQQLMKPVQVGQYQWTTSQARNTNVAEFSIPSILEKVESLTLRTLRMYAFYRMSPVVRVQINSTQFHQGQLIASFDPFSLTVNSTDYDTFSIQYATGLPHVKILASESGTIELKLPFTHPRSYLTTNSNNFNNLGYFRLTVMNPLVVAEGTSPTVTATIWIYAEDSDVHVPIYDHDPILEPTSGKLNTNLIPEMPISPPKGLIDQVKKGAVQAKDIVGNLLTMQFGQALREGQGLIDTLGEIFGFDYPSDPIAPIKTIMPLENLAVGKGKSRSQRLAIDPFSLHALDDSISSESLQAMNLKSILQMPMLLNQFLFSSTDAQDALLFSCPVHPQLSSLQILGEDKAGVQRTYLSFISNAFTYWNGGIKFDIEVVATRFHSGKLLVAYVPNVQTVPTYAQACLLPNVVIDIQQTSNTTFNVPFTSSTSMKSTLLKSEPTDTEFVDAATGMLVIYVQNILTHASNVAPSIEINTYIYGAEDFSLYVPRRPAVNLHAPYEVETTSGISISSNQTSSTQANLSKDQTKTIVRPHFGEDYSLMDLLRRFSFVGPITADYGEDVKTAVIDFFKVSPYDLTTVIIDQNLGNQISYLNYFSRIYSCWSGSIRYKIAIPASRTSTVSLALSHHPDPVHLDVVDKYNNLSGYESSYIQNGYGVVYTNLSQDNAIEFEVPYYSKYNMLLTRSSKTSQQGVDEFDQYVFNGTIKASINDANLTDKQSLDGSIYQAVGEDFRFIYLRPPPLNSSTDLFFVNTL